MLDRNEFETSLIALLKEIKEWKKLGELLGIHEWNSLESAILSREESPQPIIMKDVSPTLRFIEAPPAHNILVLIVGGAGASDASFFDICKSNLETSGFEVTLVGDEYFSGIQFDNSIFSSQKPAKSYSKFITNRVNFRRKRR